MNERERITKRDDSGYRNGYVMFNVSDAYANRMYYKLRDLEDIEDELDIDLIVIFKALKNGFYYKKESAIVHISKDDLLLRSGAIHFAGKGLIFAGLFLPFKDYGKTWALTEGELK